MNHDTQNKNDFDSVEELIGHISDVVKLCQARSRSDNGKLGIKSAYRPLVTALVNEHGESQLSLVKITGLQPPTVSITLRLMEASGYVVRKIDEFDLRRTHVYITDEGRELAERIEASNTKMRNDMLNGLTDEECETLKALIIKLKNNLEATKD